PPVDLPLSAHIPVTYIEDMNARLAIYQRIGSVESTEEVAAMQAELHDRFGAPPPSVDHLLYIQLIRSLGRRARVQSIKTDEHMFHVRVHGGVSDSQRARVDALKLKGLLVGPNQVRIDRVTAGEGWMPLLVRILRALDVSGAPAQRSEVPVG
ncbi:MAG: TRCF domain-containing protein, partial [Tepidiformaceae bacterium]